MSVNKSAECASTSDDVRTALAELYKQSMQLQEYFRGDGSGGQAGVVADKFCSQLEAVADQVTHLQHDYDALVPHLAAFDPAPHIHANGYRSCVFILHRCLQRMLRICAHIDASCRSYFFRRKHFLNELVDCGQMLAALRQVLKLLVCILQLSAPGQLLLEKAAFADDVSRSLLRAVQKFDKTIFYGRSVGFQYCASMEVALRVICIAMATYGDVFLQHHRGRQIMTAVSSASYYWYRPEQRAKRITSVLQTCNIRFCKSFWDLYETSIVLHLSHAMLPTLIVNHAFALRSEPITFQLPNNNRSFNIDPPSSHGPAKPITVRLMSNKLRQGMELLDKQVLSNRKLIGPFHPNPSCGPSPYLVIHAHGGGFVSLTSKSHDSYLRAWCRSLDVPILTIDYSLAPEYPYPRALEECFYVYAWALQNSHLLGSTAERVVLVGDSAGGNLMVGTLLRIIAADLPKPHAVIPIYTPLLIGFRPSPSRMMCLMDPILPDAVMVSCLMAYLKIDDADLKGAAQLRAPSAESTSELRRWSSTDGVGTAPAAKATATQPHPETPIVDIVVESLARSNSCSHARRRSGDHRPLSLPSSPKISGAKRSPFAKFTANNPKLASLLHLSSEKRLAKVHNVREEPLVAAVTGNDSSTGDERGGDTQSPWDLIYHYPFPEDPLLSPLLAPDDMLCQFPSVHLISCHLDPCLDDGVSFARRLFQLKAAGRYKGTVSLDCVEGVPHGFLNFAVASTDCREASRLCVRRIRESLCGRAAEYDSHPNHCADAAVVMAAAKNFPHTPSPSATVDDKLAAAMQIAQDTVLRK